MSAGRRALCLGLLGRMAALAGARAGLAAARLAAGTPAAVRVGVAASAAAALPAAHAGYNIFTGEYTIALEALQAAVAQRFPATRGYAGAFEVRLADPVVALLPEANRLALTAAVRIAQPALLPEPLAGRLTVSSGLRFDAAERAVLLHEPAADRLELPRLSPQGARTLQAVGTAVARELLRGMPVHRFTAEELRFGGRALTVGEIRVTPDGLAIAVQ